MKQLDAARDRDGIEREKRSIPVRPRWPDKELCQRIFRHLKPKWHVHHYTFMHGWEIPLDAVGKHENHRNSTWTTAIKNGKL